MQTKLPPDLKFFGRGAEGLMQAGERLISRSAWTEQPQSTLTVVLLATSLKCGRQGEGCAPVSSSPAFACFPQAAEHVECADVSLDPDLVLPVQPQCKPRHM